MDARCTYSAGEPPPGPRAHTGIGPLEVLRVALMRGDLDDLRNDLARALRRSDIAPGVLQSLLHGLQGVGIGLDGARAALALAGADCARPAERASATSELPRACLSGWAPCARSEDGACVRLRDGRPCVGGNTSRAAGLEAVHMPSRGETCFLQGAGGRTGVDEKENAHDVAERSTANARSKKPARRKRSGGRRWATRR